MPSWAKAAARLTTLGFLVGWLVSLCAAERYTFRYYTQTDGLRNLSVNCLVRDRTDFLWVGTESGLYPYDGFRFQPIGTPEINVHSLREDQAGRLWIGAIDGLYYLDGSRWGEVRQGSQHLEVGSPASFQFTPDGQLVVLSRHELLAVSSPDHGLNWNVRPYFASRRWPGLDSISSELIDKSGQLWAGCRLEICRFSSGERRVWGEAQGLPHDHWRSLFVDSGGTLWARSQHWVYVLPGGSERFIARGLGQDPKAMSSIGLDFAEDAQGRIITPFPKE